MRVVCVLNPTQDGHLTIGKEYVVKEERGSKTAGDYVLQCDGFTITFPKSCFEWTSDKVTLSRMDCYAGKWLAEATAHSPDIFDEPGVYVQFIEGCGYHPYTMTPDEADRLADRIREAAAKTREAFAAKGK